MQEQFCQDATENKLAHVERLALTRIKPGLLIALACLIHPSIHAQECQPVKKTPSSGYFIGGVIPPGKYCLTVDLRHPKQFDLHAMRFKTFVGAPLLTIYCPSWHQCTRASGQHILDIDLRGHQLIADVDDMVGIQDMVPTTHINLHNGTVTVRGTRDANVGIDLQAFFRPRQTYARQNCRQASVNCGNGQVDMVATDALPYQETRHIVDQMKVRAGWLGVQMVGIGNTLRNSVIEVDSRNAIALFGFGSIIENNTIIVHGKGTPAADDGALALWDGNGAVIRNNRFIFKGQARQAPPAIRLIDSSDVRLEGNTFEGFGSQVVARTGKSSFIEKK